jgi:hypothetical protein
MCGSQGVHMRVYVLSCDREQLFTIFQRGFHRKLEDEARRTVPGAFTFVTDLRGALAYDVGGGE